jgi:GNAT superfamily N-acetyltransferase
VIRRSLTKEDFEAILALAAADEAALRGSSRLGPNDVRNWFSRVDLDADSLGLEEDGRLAAVGWFTLWNTVGTYAGIVAQGCKGRGLGTALAEWGEERALARGALKIHAFGLAEDTAAGEIFVRRGYALARRFYEMAIELTEAPPEPVLSDGLVLAEVGDDDVRAFYDALVEAFQDHWEWHATPYEEWLEMRRGQHHDSEGPLWFVVRDGDQVAAVTRNEADVNGGGYVGAIGVRRPWRGRGLAKALLYRTFAEFYRRGQTRVTLGVDSESPTGATHLYERVGMSVESSTVVYEKVPAR